MNINLPKSSTILFVNIFILLIFIISVYVLLTRNITLNKTKKEEVVFYQIKEKSTNLLTKVLYEHSLKKDIILEKHNQALKLIQDGMDFNTVYEEINKDFENYPFNIHILNNKYIVEDSSIFFNIGSDLSFCKDIFENHKLDKEIRVSIPEYSPEFLRFVSYTDSYVENINRILQISYSYEGFNEELKELQLFVDSIPNVQNYVSFIYFDDYIGNFTFKDIQTFKESIQDKELSFHQGEKVLDILKENNYYSYYKTKDKDSLHVIYLLQASPIFDEIKILFCIVFNENSYHEDILNIRLLSLFIFIIGALTIYFIYKLRVIELLLNYKDKFIAHSIHEIKTPLSIITINTQLREKVYGSDKFTNKINGAIRTLENSYEDMTFLHTKDKIVYEIVNINLKKALDNRVKYFDTIANMQNRNIELKISNNFFVNMGKIELNRLVDNNISNALKYSFIGSTITIFLKDNILEFHSFGQRIENPKEIFKKYKREDKNTGGHGLGLAIVSDICKKYNFEIEVESHSNSLNIFRYILS